jgi:hypothetical protein
VRLVAPATRLVAAASYDDPVLVTDAPPSADAARMLRAWAWLLPPAYVAVAVSRFGDWYVATPDGAVHHLSIWNGTLTCVAPSSARFQTWLASPAGRDANYAELIAQLEGRGMRVADGECFAFVPPPMIAGDIAIDRVLVKKLEATTVVMADVFAP